MKFVLYIPVLLMKSKVKVTLNLTLVKKLIAVKAMN